jgi:SAM-dependent methyltransferase
LTTTEPESGEFSDHGLRSNPLALQPSAWVVRFGQSLRPGARVLDLACGHRRQAAWFAQRGCQVTAVDVDPACEASLRQHPEVRFVLADLEAGPWPLAEERFDAVVVVHYLHRPLLARIRAALAPDGLLIYETFATGNERFGRPRNPDFLLRPGELLTAFAGLRIIAFEDGHVSEPPAMIQRLAALNCEPDRQAPVEALAI